MNLDFPLNPLLRHRSPWSGLVFLTLALGGLPLGAQNTSTAAEAEPVTVRRSPSIRYESLPAQTPPTLSRRLVAPFLVDPLVMDAPGLQDAPRIVAAEDSRVLLTRGDRAYARGPLNHPLLDDPGRKQKIFQIFREATPLKDPVTGEVLGYEAQLLGRATLTRSESTQAAGSATPTKVDIIPATLEIIGALEDIRVGDRLVPEPPPAVFTDLPLAPSIAVDARIVSVYGTSVVNAAQRQVVTLNRGTRDGLEQGNVLAILKEGPRLVDQTDELRSLLKLPDERNGLLLVFRTYEKLSYCLVTETTDAVRVGDRLVNPR
jgi:hypothetical protein